MVAFRAPWTVFVLLLLVFKVSSETAEVAQKLVQFMENIDPGNSLKDPNFGWNLSSDPCEAKWKGVFCVNTPSVKRIVLDDMNLNGILDARLACSAKNLAVLSLNNNNVVGTLPEEISDCAHLTHLYLSGNNFTGNLPEGLAKLNNLKRADISRNGFSGDLPEDLSRISGLKTFRAEFNSLTGKIPDFNFSNLIDFNVSFNSFTGPVPDSNSQLNSSSLLGNPGLCGKPLSKPCLVMTAPNPKGEEKHKHPPTKKYLIYSGYAILALIILLLILFKVVRMKRSRAKRRSSRVVSPEKPTSSSSEFKGGESRSEFSMTSPDDNGKTSSLVVLSSPVVNGLKFEDLLRAPAELVGRGKNGTLYKVTLSPGPTTVAVKRIKDWNISLDEFKAKMYRINDVKHPNVLPALAFYCSQQEKLLVYEFQHKGSLCRYLNGSQEGQTFDWGSRLNVAARTANALAFMHKELKTEGIPHGNLKSSNILLNNDMEPCISEYGLMFIDHEDQSLQKQLNNSESIDKSPFKSDIYSLGLILLELLTGKLVNNRASELAGWVRAVVTEEWTAEVFDRALVGASEERMVNLLQVALKCINPSQDARPDSSQVASAINSIKEDEERSVSSSTEL